jgi:hypothetical protein
MPCNKELNLYRSERWHNDNHVAMAVDIDDNDKKKNEKKNNEKNNEKDSKFKCRFHNVSS